MNVNDPVPNLLTKLLLLRLYPFINIHYYFQRCSNLESLEVQISNQWTEIFRGLPNQVSNIDLSAYTEFRMLLYASTIIGGWRVFPVNSPGTYVSINYYQSAGVNYEATFNLIDGILGYKTFTGNTWGGTTFTLIIQAK